MDEEDVSIRVEYKDIEDDPLLEDLDDQAGTDNANYNNVPRNIQGDLDGNY